MRTSFALLVCLATFACGKKPTESAPPAMEHAPSASAHDESSCPANEMSATNSGSPAPAAAPAAGTYGAPLSDAAIIPLQEITANPERFAGQRIKTEGEVAAVCQTAGCWMEMRSTNGRAVRVPMAGHSFFLPRDCAGKHAVIEGEVALRTLSPGAQAHLASEGAQAAGANLQITAFGVELR